MKGFAFGNLQQVDQEEFEDDEDDEDEEADEEMEVEGQVPGEPLETVNGMDFEIHSQIFLHRSHIFMDSVGHGPWLIVYR